MFEIPRLRRLGVTGSPARMRFSLRFVAIGLYLFNPLDLASPRRNIADAVVVGTLDSRLLSVPRTCSTRGCASGRTPDDVPRRRAALLVAAIVAVAFALRFVNLATVPLDVHGDFASTGLVAREILQGQVAGVVATAWYDEPVIAFAQAALTMWIFGDNLFGMNMEAVSPGRRS